MRPERMLSRITAAASRFSGSLLDMVYPRRCAGCGADVVSALGHLCWDCRSSFVMIAAPFCSHCGDPIEGDVRRETVCSWCRGSRPAFDRARSAVRFRAGVREALHRFKYGGAMHLRSELGELLQACVNVHLHDVLLDAVTCVPLHPERERRRSYNQSALLARELARRLRLPCSARLLARVRPTLSQTNLNASERRANVRGAFAVRDLDWAAGRRWLLVDDTMTTGATVCEASCVLMAAGAAAVYVVTVARG